MPIIIILSAVIIFCLLLFLSLIGQGRGDFSFFISNPIAHRGLHDGDLCPENSIAAFKRAVEKGCSIELDVHILKDGTLAVFHDDDLKRMAGLDRKLRDMTFSEIKKITLGKSQETIPTLKEVLELVDGRVPLLIELKTDGGVKGLCAAVKKELTGYNGKVCVQSFDPRPLRWFLKNCPHIPRGILSEKFRNGPAFPTVLIRFLISALFLNFQTAPSFISYRFTDRKNLLFWITVKVWKIKGFVWTITTKADFKTALNEGYIPISEKIFSKGDQ